MIYDEMVREFGFDPLWRRDEERMTRRLEAAFRNAFDPLLERLESR